MAQSLNNLSVLLRTQGAYTEARSYYERALAIFEARLGSNHRYTQIVQDNLSTLDQAIEN